MKRIAVILAVGGVLLGLTTFLSPRIAERISPLVASNAAVSAPDVCQAAKIKSAGKYAQLQLLCFSKAAQQGLPAEPTCLGSAAAKLAQGFSTAEKSGTCTTVADAPTVTALVDSYVAQIAGDLPFSTGSGPCTKSKFKAAATLVFTAAKAYSLNEKEPDAPRLNISNSNASLTFAKSMSKLAQKGSATGVVCPGSATVVSGHVFALLEKLATSLCSSCSTETTDLSPAGGGVVRLTHSADMTVSAGTSTATFYGSDGVPGDDSGGLVPPLLTVTVVPNAGSLSIGDFVESFADGRYYNYSEVIPTTVENHEALLFSDLASATPRRPSLVVFIALPNDIVVICGNQESQSEFFSAIDTIALP